jgi:hypothetical protein
VLDSAEPKAAEAQLKRNTERDPYGKRQTVLDEMIKEAWRELLLLR